MTMTVGMFVWEELVSQDASILQPFADAGVSRVYVKAADGVVGGKWFSQLSNNLTALKAMFQEVYGWHYIYGQGLESSIALSVSALDIDGWVIDAESEFEKANSNPSVYGVPVMKAFGLRPVLLTSFAYAAEHSGIGYKSWDTIIDGFMPQLFPLYSGWPNIPGSITLAYQQYTGLGLTKPIYPLGELFLEAPLTPTQMVADNDVTSFLGNANVGGYEHAALWRAGIVSPTPIKNFIKPTPPGPTLEQRVAKLEQWARTLQPYPS